jgi:hypothetical protein
VPQIVRKAAFLVRGMRFEASEAEVRVTMLCALSWFNRVECFPLDGSPGLQKRRDMRRGWQRGSAATQADGSILLTMFWPDPLPGTARDELRVAGDALHVRMTAQIGQAGVAESHAVFRRRGPGRPPLDVAP